MEGRSQIQHWWTYPTIKCNIRRLSILLADLAYLCYCYNSCLLFHPLLHSFVFKTAEMTQQGKWRGYLCLTAPIKWKGVFHHNQTFLERLVTNTYHYPPWLWRNLKFQVRNFRSVSTQLVRMTNLWSNSISIYANSFNLRTAHIT